MRTNHAILGRTLKAGFFTSLALAIGAGVGGGMTISNILKPKQKTQAAAAPTAIPAAGTASVLQQKAADTASETALKKRRARTQTNLTGPRGLLTNPKTSTPSLATTLG